MIDFEAKAEKIRCDLAFAPFGLSSDEDRRLAMVAIIATALAEAVAAEREACAGAADKFAKDGDWEKDACIGIAAAIRSRGDVK